MADLSAFRKFLNYAEILAVRWADHVIVDTPSVQRRLARVYGISPSKVTPLIQHGSFDEEEVAKYLSVRAKSPSPPDKIVLNVSKVHPTKNQLAVVKAVKQVLEADPDVKFVFAGAILDASYMTTIDRYIAENKLGGSVQFRGEVTREELFDLYASATLFVFPSVMESQGVVIIEAMTFGVPVIASDIEPVQDVAALSPNTITVVSPDDTAKLASEISRLLGDADLRQKLATESRTLAQRLSWENMALDTLQIYKKVLKSSRE